MKKIKGLENLTDEELATRMKQANGDAEVYFNEIYKRHKKRIYSMSFNILGNKLDAEDNTQEVFSKIYHKKESYEPNAKLTTWIFRITRNNIIDKLRRKHLKVDNSFSEYFSYLEHDSDDVTMEEHFEGLLESPLNPEEITLKNEKNEKIKSHLKLIKSQDIDYGKYLYLVYFQGKSYREISDKLELPSGTVKSHLYRARELLRERLSNDKYFA